MRMNKEFFVSTFREWRLYIETFLKWLVIASLIGGAGGLIGAIFHHSIDMAEVFRSTHPWLLWLLPLAGLLIVGFYKMTKTEGLNTNHVIRAVHKGKRLSVLLMPSIFFAGSSTLVQPKTKSFNLATHWKMGFFYEFFCQI